MRKFTWVIAALLFASGMPGASGIDSAGSVGERRQREALVALSEGLKALETKDYDTAISRLNKAVDNKNLTSENQVAALYGRGFAYYRKDDCPNAMTDFDRIMVEKANDGQYHFIRFACLDKAGDRAGAVAALDKAIEVAPDRADILRVRCVLRFNGQDFVKALPDCEKVVASIPGDADIWLAIAQSLETLGQKDKALNAYRKLLSLKPDSKPAQDGIQRMGG